MQAGTWVPLHSAAGMAGERTKLIVNTREQLGSRETRRLRKRGFVPGVLYGRDEPVAFAVEERELRRALTGKAGLHSILDVEIDGTGTTHASILKDYQVDAVRGGVTHVDRTQFHPERRRHGLDCAKLADPRRYGGIAKDCCAYNVRRYLFEQF